MEEGIQTSLYVILSPSLDGVSGRYYRNCKEGTTREDALNVEWQQDFWNASNKMVKLTEKDPQI